MHQQGTEPADMGPQAWYQAPGYLISENREGMGMYQSGLTQKGVGERWACENQLECDRPPGTLIPSPACIWWNGASSGCVALLLAREADRGSPLVLLEAKITEASLLSPLTNDKCLASLE